MDWIISHQRGIAIYVVVHIATYFLFVHVLGKGHIKNDKKDFGKLEPFKRVDVGKWSIIMQLPLIMTVWPRWIIGMVNLFLYMLWVMIFMIGVKDKVSPFRYKMIRNMGALSCRSQAFLGGLAWVNLEYVENCGYEKYLGPEWKAQWTGAGTIVCNHICWMDILVTIAYFFPSFVSKKSIKSYPGVGPIAQAIDCVFLDRAGTKEQKIAAGQAIEKRQKENEDGSRAPILIFPEGATTNNKSVIQFKRGPFSGLSSVQPIGLKYWSLNGISFQNDTLGQSHYYFCMLSYFGTLHMKVYPVFKPNEYFWENHWDGKEQKWEAYARAVRQIIIDSHGLESSPIQMDDKFEFKDLMKGKKIVKKE